LMVDFTPRFVETPIICISSTTTLAALATPPLQNVGGHLVKAGVVQLLDYAEDHNLTWVLVASDWEMQTAAEYGQLECMQWLRAHGCPWSEGTAVCIVLITPQVSCSACAVLGTCSRLYDHGRAICSHSHA
jgi:hypothetical protein